MGWLAKAPPAATCPTGHRYLRSPCCRLDKEDIYLGGPLSLANFDVVNRVNVNRCLSVIEPRRYKVEIVKAPGRKITVGQEVLWSYNLNATKRSCPNFSPQNEWQLVGVMYITSILAVTSLASSLLTPILYCVIQDTCCSEVETCMPGPIPGRLQEEAAPLPEPSAPTPAPSKRRKVGGQRPLKTSACVRSFKVCTYCGVDISTLVAEGKKENMKRHWALKHAVNLCEEMGVIVDDAAQPVSAKAFIKHLDKVDHVYNSLHNHNYKVVPACNFFDIM